MKRFEKFDKKDIWKPLTIDPSIYVKGEIIELLDNILVKLQSNADNEEIVESIFKVCVEKFRMNVVRDIMATAIPEWRIKQLERNFLIGELLDKNEKKDEEGQ
jgi:hypothetical protein